MPEYIERDKIHNCLDDLSSENLIGNDNDTFISLPKAHDKIDDVPPADVAEVKYGEWITRKSIHNEEYYVCSACISATDDIYRYCPNCGADMRGGKDG